METQLCTHCQQDRPLDRFSIRKGRPVRICKDCRCAVEKQRRTEQRQLVTCIDCGKQWLMWPGNLQRWQGRCQKCCVAYCYREERARTHKTCLYCQETKPLDAFPMADKSSERRAHWCYECYRAHRRGYYQTRQEYARSYARTWIKAHKEQSALRSERRRARKRQADTGTVTAQAWQAVIAAYRGRCAYCGAAYAVMEHIQPLVRGGLHDISNVVPACEPCNQRKYRYTPEEVGMRVYSPAQLDLQRG